MAKSMNGQSNLFNPTTCEASSSAISLPGLADGPTRSDSPDGPIAAKCGPVRALANAIQAQLEVGKPRPNVGRGSAALLRRIDLRLSLVNRLLRLAPGWMRSAMISSDWSTTVRAAILPAYVTGADHARERIYFAGHTHRHGQSGGGVDAEAPWMSWPRSYTRDVVCPDGLSARVAQKRAFGNAIVPQVAAVFIEACMSIGGIEHLYADAVAKGDDVL